MAANTTVTLAGGGSGAFYSDAACSTEVTSVALVVGTDTQSFYFRDTKIESLTLTAAASGLSSDGIPMLVGPGVLSQTALTGPSSVTAGKCSTAIVATSKDSDGNIVPVVSNTVVSLSGGGSGGFYSDSNCSVSIKSMTIAADTSAQSFYFRDSKTETLSLEASVSGVSTGTLPITVTSAAASQIILSGPAAVNQGSCTPIITATTEDASGNISAVTSSTTVNLSGGGSGKFYSDSACTVAVTSVAIASGSSSSGFYFLDPNSEALKLSAAATGLSAGTLTLSINPLLYHLRYRQSCFGRRLCDRDFVWAGERNDYRKFDWNLQFPGVGEWSLHRIGEQFRVHDYANQPNRHDQWRGFNRSQLHRHADHLYYFRNHHQWSISHGYPERGGKRDSDR